jgi:hypothetical protein
MEIARPEGALARRVWADVERALRQSADRLHTGTRGGVANRPAGGARVNDIPRHDTRAGRAAARGIGSRRGPGLPRRVLPRADPGRTDFTLRNTPNRPTRHHTRVARRERRAAIAAIQRDHREVANGSGLQGRSSRDRPTGDQARYLAPCSAAGQGRPAPTGILPAAGRADAHQNMHPDERGRPVPQRAHPVLVAAAPRLWLDAERTDCAAHAARI